MSKHTPGPWRIGNLASYDGYTGQPYRNVWAGQGEAATVVARAIRSEGVMTNDVDADARLIAVAPELLEALKELMEYAGIIEERCDAVATNKARAAIAKAEGKL